MKKKNNLFDMEKDIALILYLLENNQYELEKTNHNLNKIENELLKNKNNLYEYHHPDSLISQFNIVSKFVGDQDDINLNKIKIISKFSNQTTEIEKLFIRCKELQTTKHSFQKKIESLNCNFNEKRKIILAKPTLIQPFKNILKSFIADEKINLTKSQNYFFDELRATNRQSNSVINKIQWKDLSNFFQKHDNELKATKNNSILYLRIVNRKCKQIIDIRNFILQFYQKQNIFFNEISLLLEECDLKVKEERFFNFQNLINEHFKKIESINNLKVEDTIRIGINSLTSNQSNGLTWDIYNDNENFNLNQNQNQVYTITT